MTADRRRQVAEEVRAAFGVSQRRAHPRYGYRRVWALLAREGWGVNKKAIHRLGRLAGL
jgi:hypothetical protein